MNNTPSVNASTEDHVPDPKEAILTYYKQAKRTQMDLTTAERGAYLAWGVAWLIGFGALWVSGRSDNGQSPVWALNVFYACILAAAVVSTIIGVRAGQGTRSASSWSGAIYGVAWFCSFPVGLFMVAWFCRTYGIDMANAGLMFTSVSVFIVGTLYIAGAAIWQDRSLLIIGLWMLALTVVGTIAGLPQAYLVMALAGGGGMVVAFAEETWRIHRHAAQAAKAAR